MTLVHAFNILMITAASAFLLIPCVLVMQLLMPRTVLDRYWKEPYFRPAELVLLSGVLAPLRTLMFIWAIAFPRLGKKRDVVAVHVLVPKWYRILSGVIAIWGVAGLLILVLLTVGTLSYMFLNGQPIRL